MSCVLCKAPQFPLLLFKLLLVICSSNKPCCSDRRGVVCKQALFGGKLWPPKRACLQARCGGLVVSVLDLGLGILGLSPGWGPCIVFLGKALYSHSASLHLCMNGYQEIYLLGHNPAMD